MPGTGLIWRCATPIKFFASAYWAVIFGKTLILRAKSWSQIIRRVSLLPGKYGILCKLYNACLMQVVFPECL